MKHNDYRDICDFAQNFYDENSLFLPAKNIPILWLVQIKRYDVINNKFNALFYYEYIMCLMGIHSKCFKHKKN